MKWSPQQEQALKTVDTWLKHAEPIFLLGGFAGVGKTELAKHFAANVNGRVVFGTFTGKAAHVLQQRGCHNAQTIHSLIYQLKDKSTATLLQLEKKVVEFEKLLRDLVLADKLKAAGKVEKKLLHARKQVQIEKENLKRPVFKLNPDSDLVGASLLVLDECYMISQEMLDDLLTFGVKILALGDPAQLPPVFGKSAFGKPDLMLTEIHRQAKDSPIIRLATDVREGRRPKLCDWGDVKVVKKTDKEKALEVDQILVGRNKTRRGCNARVRDLLGYTSNFPEQWDKLVCLRNDYDAGVLNGSVWTVHNIISEDVDAMRAFYEIDSPELGSPRVVESHLQEFVGEEIPMGCWRDAQKFDFGYALTVHKAQGSQWNSVLLFDESGVFEEPNKWLYTGITRAAKKLTVVI